MKKTPAAEAAPARRTVVLLSELPVDGIARPLRAGTVVEADAERFANLHEGHVRDADDKDLAIAGDLMVTLDLPEDEDLAGNDALTDAAGNDTITAPSGNDSITGPSGNDTVTGTAEG